MKDNTINLKAMVKWKFIPKDIQHKIIENVFCPKCFVTTIVDYKIEDNEFGIVLKGKCKKCGGSVARVVED